jgi:hypothetical protein
MYGRFADSLLDVTVYLWEKRFVGFEGSYFGPRRILLGLLTLRMTIVIRQNVGNYLPNETALRSRELNL